MANGCPMCGGMDFDTDEHTVLGNQGSAVRYGSTRGFFLFRGWQTQPIKARACLNCGYIAMFVEDVDAWKEQVERERETDE
jgi:hypothetical protein